MTRNSDQELIAAVVEYVTDSTCPLSAAEYAAELAKNCGLGARVPLASLARFTAVIEMAIAAGLLEAKPHGLFPATPKQNQPKQLKLFD